MRACPRRDGPRADTSLAAPRLPGFPACPVLAGARGPPGPALPHSWQGSGHPQALHRPVLPCPVPRVLTLLLQGAWLYSVYLATLDMGGGGTSLPPFPPSSHGREENEGAAGSSLPVWEDFLLHKPSLSQLFLCSHGLGM